MQLALPVHHTASWDGQQYQEDDFSSASGILLFALQTCFGIRWQIPGSSASGATQREARSWHVVDSMVGAAGWCTIMREQVHDKAGGIRMACAVRTVSRRFAHWLAVQVRCCQCSDVVSLRGIETIDVCSAQAPRQHCQCGSARNRHPKCRTCVREEEQFSAWCGRQFAREDSDDS